MLISLACLRMQLYHDTFFYNYPHKLCYRYTFIFILDTTVAQLLITAVLERNRYYLKTLAKIVQFLVVNELALKPHLHGRLFCVQFFDKNGCGKGASTQ